jgi:hypothetical protein
MLLYGAVVALLAIVVSRWETDRRYLCSASECKDNPLSLSGFISWELHRQCIIYRQVIMNFMINILPHTSLTFQALISHLAVA